MGDRFSKGSYSSDGSARGRRLYEHLNGVGNSKRRRGRGFDVSAVDSREVVRWDVSGTPGSGVRNFYASVVTSQFVSERYG